MVGQPAAEQAKKDGLEFNKLIAMLLELRQTEITNAQSGKIAPALKYAGRFATMRELADAVVQKHEQDLKNLQGGGQAEETQPKPAEAVTEAEVLATTEAKPALEEEPTQERRRGHNKATTHLPWAGVSDEQMWCLVDPEAPRKGGEEEKEVLHFFDVSVKENQSLDHQSTELKNEMKPHEDEMAKELKDLESQDDAADDNHELRDRVCTIIRCVEQGDFKLAKLRHQQVDNLESIRLAKVTMWKFYETEKLNELLEAIEKEIRSGSLSSDTAERLSKLEKEFSDACKGFDKDAEDSVHLTEELMAKAAKIREKYATVAKDDIWDVDGEEQEVQMELMKIIFELQTMNNKRVYIRDKEEKMLAHLFTLRHVRALMRRYEEVKETLDSGDVEKMKEKMKQLNQLSNLIQSRVATTKEKISQTFTKAKEKRSKLLEIGPKVHTSETDNLRMEAMRLTFDMAVEDTHLAWLRTDQLQLVDLAGKLRSCAAFPEKKQGSKGSAKRWSMGENKLPSAPASAR